MAQMAKADRKMDGVMGVSPWGSGERHAPASHQANTRTEHLFPDGQGHSPASGIEVQQVFPQPSQTQW
jgi:hypothetical protein